MKFDQFLFDFGGFFGPGNVIFKDTVTGNFRYKQFGHIFNEILDGDFRDDDDVF